MIKSVYVRTIVKAIILNEALCPNLSWIIPRRNAPHNVPRPRNVNVYKARAFLSSSLIDSDTIFDGSVSFMRETQNLTKMEA